MKNAEELRDKEFERDRRFSDTVTGQLYDKTGRIAPGLIAALTGGLSRAATGGGSGPITSGMYNYGFPAALGIGAGVAGANLPLAYNAVYTEPDNPRKRGYEAYAENLPPDHPRKAEFETYARGLPTANPVREAASSELYDPQKFKERAILGAVEGVTGGLLGADAARAVSRGGGAISNVAGRVQSWGRRDPQSIGPTSEMQSSGIPSGAGASSPKPTAGATSSGGNSQATVPSEELVRTLAQGQLPSSAVAANSDDLLRALQNPANRNLPKSAEVKRGKDKLGRPFAKDPDDGRFTSDPDK